MKGLYTTEKEDAMKDHEIIDLYWEQKEAAIPATAEKYGSYCHSISCNILHNDKDAEDVSMIPG